MSIALPATSVVHEAIDERQFVRAKLPAKVVLTDADQRHIPCELLDISLGGLGLSCKEPLTINGIYPVLIVLSVKGVDLNIKGQISVLKQDEHKVGARFVDMEPDRTDILRYVISAYMSGEMADINGLFNVMQRENYIKERKQKHQHVRTPWERAKALFGTLVFSLLGLGAIAFAAYQAYGLYFRFPAAQAQVFSTNHVISVPDNGVVKYLLPANATEVKQGEPLLSVSSQLATRLTSANDMAVISQLSSADANSILGLANVETVIASPCDCVLYFPEGRKEGFGYKGDVLLHLLPKDAALLVEARLPYSQLDSLSSVTHIDMQVYGDSRNFTGEIIGSHIDTDTQQVLLILKPDAQLDSAAYLKPVWVQFSKGVTLPANPLG